VVTQLGQPQVRVGATIANTLAYYGKVLITAVKSFIVEALVRVDGEIIPENNRPQNH
jgi:hypothetical protein